MPEQTADHRSTIEAILDNCRRSTLPYQQAHRGDSFGTAFWFNDLVSEDDDSETYVRYLMTAGASTRYDLAEIRLRPELSDTPMSANGLMMPRFQEGWIPLGDSGVSVLPAAVLHALARRKKWAWATDEITDGIAAKPEDIALLDDGPLPAYALGHDVGPDRTQREQAVVIGEVARSGDGREFVWHGHAPQGCAGAPVFVGLHLADRSFKLVCLGVLLPAEGEGETTRHPVATFDHIRTAVRDLSQRPADDADVAAPAPTRWWRRRK
ncbi:hypothetical protein SAMN05216483_2870 [Streptomyces sp. 2131.1]|uniref:hypothetical protein n=1 Tax=Streptomyces sp. 2131.1 TaxID=1855346 RepID=UPI0008957601|nr:hypothetical protein [Streptomyces sp. 2131.1]SED00135.1 hypothetical protein SAMN05216483_2870 [Streptomyces sp. 2131.1]